MPEINSLTKKHLICRIGHQNWPRDNKKSYWTKTWNLDQCSMQYYALHCSHSTCKCTSTHWCRTQLNDLHISWGFGAPLTVISHFYRFILTIVLLAIRLRTTLASLNRLHENSNVPGISTAAMKLVQSELDRLEVKMEAI